MIEHIRFRKLPLTGVDAMVASTARTFPKHTHDQFGIGVVDSGGHASASDRRQVEAGPGRLIFVNPGEVHDGRGVGGRPRSWRILYFDPALLGDLRADVLDGAGESFLFAAPVFADEGLRRLFDAAFAHATAGGAAREPMACESALLRLAARMAVNSTTGIRHANDPTACIRRVRDRIDADPAARMTLPGLARDAGLSRYQLIRAFSRQLGLAPHAYILQQRVLLARRLLRQGQAPAETAAAAGFYDQSHLSRCFLRQFGTSPGRYASYAS